MNDRSGRDGFLPHLALVAVQIMFGTWPIFGKVVLRVVPATSLVAFRVGGAALAFLLLRSLTGGMPVTRKGDYGRFFLYALLGVVLNQLLFTKGLSLSTAVNSTIIGTTIPAFALLVSVVLGFERLTIRKAVGTAIAASGVIYLVDPFNAELAGDKTLGNLLLITNTIAYAAYISLSQETFRRYGTLTALGWIFIFGSLFTVPLGSYYFLQTNTAEITWTIWLLILYVILVPTVGAYFLNAWALARVAPSTVAAYIYLQPLITFAVAPLVLGQEESWNPRMLLATALIFAGVALVTLHSKSRAVEELSERPDAGGH